MTYREYTRDDVARPAFFQNVVYETNAKQLRYKDIKIDMLEATNEKVIYSIVEDGLKYGVFDIYDPPTEYKQILLHEEYSKFLTHHR